MNKPQAKFCDQCGFDLAEHVGPGSRNAGASVAEVDPLPANTTAPGVPLLQPGVPNELRRGKGHSRETQRLDAPVVATPETVRRAEETVKVATVNRSSANGVEADPQPEATIQGAFYLRRQAALQAEAHQEAVGWLVEPGPGGVEAEHLWPVSRGVTLVGREERAVGQGVVLARPGIADVHVVVFHRGGRTWIVDLATAEGSRVNDEPLAPLFGRELRDGDVLRLGDVTLVYHDADLQAAAKP